MSAPALRTCEPECGLRGALQSMATQLYSDGYAELLHRDTVCILLRLAQGQAVIDA